MFGALLGAIAAPLIGGLFNRNNNRSNQAQQSAINAQNAAQAQRFRTEDRARFLRDRARDRQIFVQDRQNDRRYAGDVTRSQRRREDQITADNRAYLEAERIRDQRNLNEATRRAVDTRGVDFQKLRNDAIAAGFNPLSAMGMAGMYSTEVNRQVVGTGGISGGSGVASPGGAISAGSAGAHVGGYGPSGGGSVSQFTPAISSGGFIADATQRALDTVFSAPAGPDPLADALRAALNTNSVVEDAQARNPRQNFGYDITEVKPYRPPVEIGGPALSRGTSAEAAAQSGSDEMVTPSALPLKWGGRDFKPSGRFSDAEAAESRYGELAGELIGMDSLIHDAGRAARNWTDRNGWTTRKPVLSQSARPRIKPGTVVPDGYGGVYW